MRKTAGHNEYPILELLGGDRRTVREVLALSKANNPKLVFLCETRKVSVKVEKLRWRLGLKGFHGVDSDGRSGGLALF